MQRSVIRTFLVSLVCAGSAYAAPPPSPPVTAAPPPAMTAPPSKPMDPAFAAGDFDTAGRDYETILAQSASDLDALIELARVRLYQERRKDARELAQNALAIDPKNAAAAKILAAIGTRDAAFTGDTYRAHVPAAGVKIRFVTVDPLPVVEVSVLGRGKSRFVIDTGAPDLVLDADFAREVGIQASDEKKGTFAGGAQAPYQRAVVKQLQIGSLRVENVPVAVLAVRATAPIPGMRIDGIVGTGFLAHFLSTLDYKHAMLILRPRSQSPAFEKAAAGRNAASVAMWLVGDHFVFARGRLNDGPEGLFNIDTGLAGGGIQATKATLDAASIVLDMAHVQTGKGGGGDVSFIPFKASATLGGVTENDLDGIYTPGGDQYGIFAFKVAGTLSHQFFRKHAVTFDFDAMRLVIEG